jgi:tetratricopeptide (TPR) repeat protein
MARAIEAAQECIRLAKQAGFVAGVQQSAFDLVLIYGGLGDLRQAREAAALHRSVSEGAHLFDPLGYILAARLHLLLGELPQARTALDAARSSVAAETLSAYIAWFVGLVEAELLLAEGEHARLLALADEAMPVVRQAGIRLFLSDVLYFRGKALVAMGHMDEAHAALGEARAEAEAIGSRRSLWPILMALSDVATRRGNPAEADRLRRQAREIVEYIAAHSPVELRASFLDLPDVKVVAREG